MNRLPIVLSLATASLALGDQTCVTPNASIPDNTTSGITIPIDIAAGPGEVIESLSVSLQLSHPWVGDLVVVLESPGGTQIILLDRPGIPSSGFPGPFGCGGRDINANFTDSASTPAEDICSYAAQPVIIGNVLPSESLSAMIGEPAAGIWLLHVSDRSPYDTGVLTQVCLTTSTIASCPPDLTGDGVLDFFDVSAFLNAINTGAPAGDFNGDGVYDFFDVSAFLNAYSAGCP
jgi:subtilisin-like proprotein convertase family protein